MAVSRRRFLRHGGVATVACVAGPLFAFGGRNASIDNPDKTGNLRATTIPLPSHVDRFAFTSLVGSSFKVTSGQQTLFLTLLNVADPPPITEPNTASFAVMPPKSTLPAIVTTGYTLSFLGSVNQPLRQGTYTFEHPRLGSFSLFIVPGGPDTYTAIFNFLGQASVLNPPPPRGPNIDTTPGHGPNGTGSSNGGGLSSVSGAVDAGRPTQQGIQSIDRDALKSKLPE